MTFSLVALNLRDGLGRLAFATTLAAGAISTTDAALMPYADIARILTIAVVIGITSLVLLALLARKIAVAAPKVSDC
ncbi:MAG: hypothetical protein KIH44_013645 [Octadecabacter sp.]|nr:hypothetical protein [Octadecabacter sp.]